MPQPSLTDLLTQVWLAAPEKLPPESALRLANELAATLPEDPTTKSRDTAIRGCRHGRLYRIHRLGRTEARQQANRIGYLSAYRQRSTTT
jgi:hypothetical protein